VAESTLALGYNDFLRTIGRYLGFLGEGEDASSLSSGELTLCEEILDAALLMVYSPPILPREKSQHQWSWLYPTTTLAIVANTEDYDLPDDFGGIQGMCTLDATTRYLPVPVISEVEIRKMRAGGTTTGHPQFVATRPKDTSVTSDEGQRWELLVYPTPDGSYTLQYTYAVLPNKLSSSKPYPLGGMSIGKLVRQACLAVAEQQEHDGAGHHTALFMQMLQAEVEADRARHTPEFFGQNLNYQDSLMRRVPSGKVATYNDTEWGD